MLPYCYALSNFTRLSKNVKVNFTEVYGAPEVFVRAHCFTDHYLPRKAEVKIWFTQTYAYLLHRKVALYKTLYWVVWLDKGYILRKFTVP